MVADGWEFGLATWHIVLAWDPRPSVRSACVRQRHARKQTSVGQKFER